MISRNYMFDEKNQYVQFLISRRNKIFHVKPYVGNSGDCLIRMGTMMLLADLGIETTVNPRKADVILWPGGNPTMWRANIEGWKEVWSMFPEKEFVVGPATFQFGIYDWPKLVTQSDACITGLFARDPVSLTNLQQAKLPGNIETGLSHDPALYLRGSAWLKEHHEASTEEYILAAFRNDHETDVMLNPFVEFFKPLIPARIKRRLNQKVKRSYKKTKIDIVRDRTTEEMPLKAYDVSAYDFESFVETVRRSYEVHTDRLHCLILAVLLGKRAFAYPTSYGKLETIYEYSIKPWAKVSFVSVKK